MILNAYHGGTIFHLARDGKHPTFQRILEHIAKQIAQDLFTDIPLQEHGGIGNEMEIRDPGGLGEDSLKGFHDIANDFVRADLAGMQGKVASLLLSEGEDILNKTRETLALRHDDIETALRFLIFRIELGLGELSIQANIRQKVLSSCET